MIRRFHWTAMARAPVIHREVDAMKRPGTLACIFCLLAGLLVGGILPMPWDRDAVPASASILSTPASSSSSDGADGGALNTQDNFPLLDTACYLLHVLKNHDYNALASLVHPERGVTFTPYSTVDFDTDLTFTREQIRDLEKDTAVYTWGITDGRGNLINMTMEQYFAAYVFNVDYTQSSQIGVDRIIMSGNALENLTDAYSGCRFVDFCVPGADPAYQGVDWNSLKLVFAPGESHWYLVGVIHGQWTV